MANRATTAEDLLRMPDDGYRYELVRGELRRMSPAGSRHGAVAMKLASALERHVAERQLGVVFAAETGFLLARNPDLVRAPDAAFVRSDRVGEDPLPDGYWPGAPDLAAEVVAPSDTFSHVQEKVSDWLDAGVGMVLVVDPARRTVTVCRSHEEVRVLTSADAIDGGDVVPGWSLPVDRLFGI